MLMRSTSLCLAVIFFICTAPVLYAQQSTAAPASILPMRLLNLTGKIVQNKVQLNWQTSEEINGYLINIERSYDGLVFVKTGSVDALGSTSMGHTYSYTDRDMVQSATYYRLKMVDRNDYFEYSKVIMVKGPLSTSLPFTLLSNPVRNNIELQFGSIAGGNTEIRLLDITGRILQRWTGNTIAKQRVRIPINSFLARGIYTVQVVQGNKQLAQKIIKQ
jgi:hypothetical protein